jgi:diaminohydroxyphosphoribosylaminopyrimidine deaminase/5-amino-6-(5-phosphoribosylamino)uracil reductase
VNDPLPEIDRIHLVHALDLAMRGRGYVEPNPMVGCVLARGERVIGQGFHAHFGGPHAEPTALASCAEDPRGATAYVTLEPCCHDNKKTPPCVPRILAAGVARVVVGTPDPNPYVNGRGIALLRDADVRVDLAPDDLAADARQLIAPFIGRTQKHRPYVIAKWAQTADNKVAGVRGRRLAITSRETNRLVHALRTRCDTILVGVGTVLSDDPLLTVRDVERIRTPLRVVLDRTLRTPTDSALVRTARQAPLRILCRPEQADSCDAVMLRAHGVEVAGVDSTDLAQAICSNEAMNVLVEPGPRLARALFEANLIDRLWVFRSRRIVAGPDGTPAPSIPDHFLDVATRIIGDDVLTEYLNSRSDLFFAPVPSADVRVLIDSPSGNPLLP